MDEASTAHESISTVGTPCDDNLVGAHCIPSPEFLIQDNTFDSQSPTLQLEELRLTEKSPPLSSFEDSEEDVKFPTKSQPSK